jgi:hypothetical protein
MFRESLRDSKSEVFRRVGIPDLKQINGLPRIGYLLSHAEHGLDEVLDALRISQEPDARTFVEKYDSISKADLKWLRWEHIALAAGLDPRLFFRLCVGILMEHEETMAQIISATAHPLVVRRAVEMALTPGGQRDRHDLFQARGFVPVPQGSTTILNRVQIANVAQAQAAADDEKIILPEMDEDLRDIHALYLGDGK